MARIAAPTLTRQRKLGAGARKEVGKGEVVHMTMVCEKKTCELKLDPTALS